MAQPRTLPPPVRGEWIPMSWEEFLAWPIEGKTEWVDGRGIAHVSTSVPHGRVVVALAQLLGAFVRVFGLGEVFVETVLLRIPSRPAGRSPDLFVVGRDDLGGRRHQYYEGPVLLAMEVLSGESDERDLIEKRAEYERSGVREYLVLDARPGRDESVYLRVDETGVYQPIAPDDLGRRHSEALPGFWLDPAWFRQDPLPNPLAILKRISPEGWRRLVDAVEREG